MGESEKQKFGSAAEIIRKGGTLLSEACPNCGGIQVRYKGRTVCLTCGNLSDISRAEAHPASDILADLRDLTLSKILEASSLLRTESDSGKQSNLVSLLLNYMELLEKTSESIEGKAKAK